MAATCVQRDVHRRVWAQDAASSFAFFCRLSYCQFNNNQISECPIAATTGFTMNRYRMQFAPEVWTPKLSPTMVSWLRPFRLRRQLAEVQVEDVTVSGEATVRAELDKGHGVLLMPNHPSHADPFVIYAAADQIATPLYIMATWHVFSGKPWVTKWLLRRHGCFSVDREANDIRAFRLASGLLQNKRQPMVIFPEGEIYHCNDRVTPFREGAAAIAVASARKAKRPIVCIPTALTYRYVEDPTESLTKVMGDLEQAIFWRRRESDPLDERIYRFAEVLLVGKELEYFQKTRSGTLPERIKALGEHILSQVELRHELKNENSSLPERVKAARRTIIKKLEACEADRATEAALNFDLDDLFLVVQSYSYPGNYVLEKPTVERLAETIDKFEEDVLGRATATIKAKRKAKVQFGEPIEVIGDKKVRDQTTALTQRVEESVQAMLDAA